MLVTPSSSVRTVKPATAVANHRKVCRRGTPGAAARSRSTSASTVTSGRLVVVSDQRSSYPEHHGHDVESLVIAPESIVSLATAVTSGAIPMVKQRTKHPLEDNPFIEGFLEWMDAPEGQQSIQALDQVFDALEHAGVDARHRKIVWADGKRLSIEQSVERIHAKHPGVPRYLIETHVLGWLENCAPESSSEHQLEELDRLVEPWLDDHERTSRAARK